jgi:hypothetical protein
MTASVSQKNGTARTREAITVELTAIRGSVGPERDRKIAGFLTAHEPLLERIAWQFGSRPAICWDNDGPGLVATVREEAWRMLAALGGRDEVPAERFWDQLHVRARSAIRELVESGATTGFSGGTGACRRRRSLRTSAARFLAERGRAASVGELVEFHDQRMRNHRADPVKQGALMSPADLVEKRIIPTDPNNLPETYCVEEASRLMRHELASALEEILARCAAVSPRTGQVARAYAAAVLADQPTAARSLATGLGWSEATVLRELHTVKEIARQVLGERGVSIESLAV